MRNLAEIDTQAAEAGTRRSGQAVLLPLGPLVAGRRGVRFQVGALVLRPTGGCGVEMLLVTSRGTGRWITPKGWPEAGCTPAQSAEREAWEEGGVRGRALPCCIGMFDYLKEGAGEEALQCMVALFPVIALREEARWPERTQRRRRWVPLEAAATEVEEPRLAALLRGLDTAAIRALVNGAAEAASAPAGKEPRP